jgi:hypothetical protein
MPFAGATTLTHTLIRFALVLAACAAGASRSALAQEKRIPSPPGSSATEVGGKHNEREGYVSGRWIEITYGRPIKRGRDLFGPPDYPDFLGDGADVWRAGANVSTQLKNEVPIVIGGKTIAPGVYTVFIDLKVDDRWTLIVSSWRAQTTYDEKNKAAIFGAYEYTPDKDVVRAPMQVEQLTHSFDQLSWQFLDMTEQGGRLALIWDKKLASVPFTVGK